MVSWLHISCPPIPRLSRDSHLSLCPADLNAGKLPQRLSTTSIAPCTQGPTQEPSAACRARQSNGSDGMAVFLSLLSFFLECVYTLIEYLTKFATIMAAITGEAFLVAGRRSTDLLKR